jgi:nitrite reductase/ring-hydroxylating ferredoxin subunit
MPDAFKKVAVLGDVPPGKMLCVQAGGARLLLANVDGEILATDELCTHEDAPLATGSLKGGFVKCPLHGSRFNLRTGAAMDEPAEEPLRTYPVRVEGNDILVNLD